MSYVLNKNLAAYVPVRFFFFSELDARHREPELVAYYLF